MSFLKSILFGYEGSYSVIGIPVEFTNVFPSNFGPPTLTDVGLISKLANKCISSNAFRWVTQSYAHVFIHEMSHALACKILTGENSRIEIYTSLCIGQTILLKIAPVDEWKIAVIEIAGSMGNITFSTCKLIAAIALKGYLTWPVSLVLGSGGMIWILGELLYAYTSVLQNDDGDFALIARHGKAYLTLAVMAILSQVALGSLLAVKLAI